MSKDKRHRKFYVQRRLQSHQQKNSNKASKASTLRFIYRKFCNLFKQKKHNKKTQFSYVNKMNPMLQYSQELECILTDYSIKSYDYSRFSDIQPIGRGGFAFVFSTVFQGKKYALKCLYNNLHLDVRTFKLLICELKHLLEVDHPNIIKFYGSTKDPQTGNIMLILQFADGGNLTECLQRKWQQNRFKFEWKKLIKFANELTLGLEYLHKNGIIHRDLHSKNILINNDKILIADFGISKHVNDTSTTSTFQGMPAYTEPQCFLKSDIKVKRDRKSDIYSLGVLLWELTSGRPPFKNLPNHAIILEISKNKREKVIPGTPTDYTELYKSCWTSDPDKRPTLEKILTELTRLSVEISVEFIENSHL
ncbi:kinase-like protein [Gigaspora margarita]|uniref:Kinase-like protein n=1 Tax=Gigaspora margarita TaxID=4874 RepID=A0A8H4EK77_GIGMA|nr:kinase-like protein [Gigaspora margarita]